MILEQILFNLIAFVLFSLIFFKLVKRNDTNYLIILVPQTIGIAINFVCILFKISTGISIKIITYLLSVILPIIILIVENKIINFSELIYILKSKIYSINNKNSSKNILLNLLNKYPKSYYGHKLLAELYEKNGEYLNAVDEYIKAIDIKEEEYVLYYKASYLLAKIDKKEDAINMLKDLLRNKPDYLQASELLGETLCEKGEFKEAINIYMESLKYNPNSYELYYSLGIAYTRLNDFQSAENYYRKAAELNSILYKAHYNLGQIALLSNELEQAVQEFKYCIDDQELDAESYFQLARISINTGDREMAINYLNISLELDVSIIEKINDETVFITVINELNVPKCIENNLKQKKQNTLTKQQIEAKEHLEKMYKITGKLNYKYMNFSKTNIEKENMKQNFQNKEKGE